MPENVEKKKLSEILNHYADWIIRVIIVNFLTILTILPIVTIIPALTSAYKIFSDALNKDETPIIKSFFNYFKEDIANKIIMSIIIVTVLGLSIFNNRLYAAYLEDGKGIMYNFGYYITLIIIIAVVMITLYLPLTFIERSGLDLKVISKISFYLAGKYFMRTFLMTLTLVIPFLMFTNSITLLLFLFIGLSLPILIIAAISKKPRIFLQETRGNL